ncbi:MAG: hypothetical protein WD826_07470 [Actinomycetota bacterium]
MRGSSWAYLGLVVVASAAYFFVPTNDAKSLITDAVAVSAGLVMLIATWRAKPYRRAAWLLLGFGVLLLAGGEIVYGEGLPVPSPADMLYVSAYPVLALGMAGLASWRSAKRRGTSIAIVASVVGATGILCWVFLILPSDGGLGLSSRLVATGYPVMDLVLLALLLRASTNHFAPTSIRCLGLGLAFMLVADSIFALQDFGNGYELGGAPDAAWLLSYGFFGAALLALPTGSRSVVFGQISSGMDLTPLTPRPPSNVATRERAITVPTMHLDVGVGSDVGFSTIIAWSGRSLLILAAAAVLLGAAWMAVDVIVLGGAYGLTGGVLSLVSGRVARL